jgi:hypothetical protein
LSLITHHFKQVAGSATVKRKEGSHGTDRLTGSPGRFDQDITESGLVQVVRADKGSGVSG